MKKIISILLSVMVLAFLPLASYAAAAVEDGNGGFIITDGTSLDGYWSDRELQTALFEGTYGIANNFSGNGTAIWCFAFDPIDISSCLESGYVEFQLYVSEPDVVIDGQFEINSNADKMCDHNEINWGGFGTTEELQPGWNTLQLPFSSSEETGGTPDFTNIQMIRLYLFVYGETELALATVRISSDNTGLVTELNTEPAPTEPQSTEPPTPNTEDSKDTEPRSSSEQTISEKPSTNADTDKAPAKGSNTGLIIGIIAAVVVIGVIVAVIQIKRRK